MVDRLGGYKKAITESKLETSIKEVDFYQMRTDNSSILAFLDEHKGNRTLFCWGLIPGYLRA